MPHAAEMPEQQSRGDGPLLLGECRAVLLDGRIEIELARSANCITAAAVIGF